MPVKVHCSHPALPGVARGTVVPMSGCGQFFPPDPNCAQVLASHVAPVVPTFPADPSCQPMRIPVIVAGRIGKGRTIIANSRTFRAIDDNSPSHLIHMPSAIDWLAEPRLA